MLVLHAPAALSAWANLLTIQSNGRTLAGCAWLTASMVLFVAKLADVPALRFATDRRSLTALILAVVLLHANLLVVVTDLPQPLADSLPLAASTLLAGALVQVQQALRGLLFGAPAARLARAVRVLGLRLAANPPARPALCARVLAPRPPPLSR